MSDIVVTPVDVVVTPDEMVTVQPKGAVVVPNGWSVVPSGGAMPQYDGVNAAVEARILQAENGMQASLDAKTAQLLSDIQDVEIGLSTETATRVSEDEALAVRIDTEVARIDDNVAAVQSGVVTNANNHSSLATQFDTYVAKTDSAIASANQEITVVAGKADANASAIGEMQVVMDGREASYAEAIDLTITKLYEHYYYPVVPADLPTDYVAGDYLKFGYDYDASHPAGTVIHAISDCAGTFDLADWETPADQTVPRQYTASSRKIETLESDTSTLSARISTEERARADGDSALASRVTTLEADTEDIDLRLTSTEEVTAGYFHVWDGVEPLQIGMKRINDDGTTWTYLGGSLGENSDGWVKDNPQDDLADLDAAYKEYNRVVALAIADGTLTTEEQALIAHAQAAVDEAKEKLNDALAIIQSPDNLLKWGNPTDAEYTGWYYGGKTTEASSRWPYVHKQTYRDRYEAKDLSATSGYHVIPLAPGEKIYISGWVNTQNTTGSIGIGARMATDGIAQNAWPVSRPVPAGQDWTYFEVEITQYEPYNGFIPFTQVHVVDANGDLVWSGAELGYAMWADLVYSRTPHRTRINEIAGWAAGASSLITDPDGNITGWSYGDGSNVQSQFKIMADVLSIVDTDDNTRTLYDGGVWRSYDSAGNYSELSAGNLKFFKAGDQYPYHYVKHIKALTASSGSTVSISGFYAFPNIIVSPKSMPTYDQANSNADQSLEVGFSNLTGDSESGNWTFDVTASLNLNDAILNYTKTYNVYDIKGAVFNVDTFQWDPDPWYSPVLSIGSGIVSYDFAFYYNLWCDDVNKTMYIEVQHSSDGTNWTTVGSYSWGGQIQHADRVLSGSVSVSSASTWQLRVYIHASGNLGEDYNIDAFRLEVTTHGEGASQLVQGTVNCLIVG